MNSNLNELQQSCLEKINFISRPLYVVIIEISKEENPRTLEPIDIKIHFNKGYDPTPYLDFLKSMGFQINRTLKKARMLFTPEFELRADLGYFSSNICRSLNNQNYKLVEDLCGKLERYFLSFSLTVTKLKTVHFPPTEDDPYPD